MTKNHTRSLIIWWLIALLLAGGMARLGFWQYGRAAEKRVQLAQVEQEMADLGAQVKLSKEALDARTQELTELKAQLSQEPEGGKQRPPATGGKNTVKTDC